MRRLRARCRQIQSLLKRAVRLELSHDAVQRLRWFVFALDHDDNISLACRHFGIARSTFLRWALRFDPADLSSLEEQARIPHTVRQPETDEHTISLIREMRQREVLCNKETIAQRLQSEHGISLSPSSVGRVIRRHGFFFADTAAHRRKRLAQPSSDSDFSA